MTLSNLRTWTSKSSGKKKGSGSYSFWQKKTVGTKVGTGSYKPKRNQGTIKSLLAKIVDKVKAKKTTSAATKSQPTKTFYVSAKPVGVIPPETLFRIPHRGFYKVVVERMSGAIESRFYHQKIGATKYAASFLGSDVAGFAIYNNKGEPMKEWITLLSQNVAAAIAAKNAKEAVATQAAIDAGPDAKRMKT